MCEGRRKRRANLTIGHSIFSHVLEGREVRREESARERKKCRFIGESIRPVTYRYYLLLCLLTFLRRGPHLIAFENKLPDLSMYCMCDVMTFSKTCDVLFEPRRLHEAGPGDYPAFATNQLPPNPTPLPQRPAWKLPV